MTSPKKRVMEPKRQMPFTTLWPRRPMALFTSTTASLEPRIRRPWPSRIVERHRTIRLAVHELLHVCAARAADLIGGAFADDHAFADEIQVVHDLERLHHVM